MIYDLKKASTALDLKMIFYWLRDSFDNLKDLTTLNCWKKLFNLLEEKTPSDMVGHTIDQHEKNSETYEHEYVNNEEGFIVEVFEAKNV